MAMYQVTKQFSWRGCLGAKALGVCRMFGLTVDRFRRSLPVHECRVEIRPGDIVCLTGPSGAGKTVLLRALARCVPAVDAVHLDRLGLPRERTVIDCFESDLAASLRMLNLVGLGDVSSILNRPARLSGGQRYRFRLARALTAGKRFVFADEFGSGLDRITATVLAYNAHRLAKRTGTTLILASSREDILADLAPDVLIVKDFRGPARVVYRTGRRVPRRGEKSGPLGRQALRDDNGGAPIADGPLEGGRGASVI